MPGTRLRLLLALAAALALGGCGIGDDEPTVPEANAETLLERLDAVEESVSDSNCALAVQQAEEFAAEVEALPAEVDDELKQGLREVPTAWCSWPRTTASASARARPATGASSRPRIHRQSRRRLRITTTRPTAEARRGEEETEPTTPEARPRRS